MSTEERVWFYDSRNYEEVYQDGKMKAVVKIDENSDVNPRRDFDNIGKFVIRKHRDYTFPNELDFDWESFDNEDNEQFEQISKTHYIFWIDLYEHSGITFSMHGEGMQCRRDTSRGYGFIAVPSEGRTKDEAEEIARQELDDRDKYCRGEIYEYETYKLVHWTSENGAEKDEREYVDGCCGFFDIDSCKEEAISLINAYKKEEVGG